MIVVYVGAMCFVCLIGCCFMCVIVLLLYRSSVLCVIGIVLGPVLFYYDMSLCILIIMLLCYFLYATCIGFF